MKKLFALLIALTLMLSFASFAHADEQVTINLWHRWSGSNEAALLSAIAGFEAANPDIKVEVTAKAGEYFDLLSSMIAEAASGNEKPDIFIGGYNLLNYIASELDPTNVDELAPSDDALKALYSHFSDTMLALSNVDGEQIGLPLAVSNSVMYVNMDIFHEAGLTEADIPKTWEEVVEVSKKIKEATPGKNYTTIGLDLPDTWPDQGVIFSHGGEMLTADKQRVDFTNQGLIDALTFWQDLYKAGYITPCTAEEIIAEFMQGTKAMFCTTIMKVTTFKESGNFELVVAPEPYFKDYEKKLPAGGTAMISFSTSDAKKAAAFRFMEYMASEEGMNLFTKSGYLCPTDAKVDTIFGQDVAYSQMGDMRPWECWPGGAAGLEIESRWISVRDSMLWEGLDVVSTMTALEEECNNLLDNQ